MLRKRRTKPLDEVKDVIEAELRKEKAQQLVEKEAKRAFNRLFKSKNLEEFAKETGMKVQETGYFVFGSSPEDAAGKESFFERSFCSGKRRAVLSLCRWTEILYLRLEDKRESQIAPLDEVKPDITASN